MPAGQLREFLNALRSVPRETNEQGDLFGFDDSAIQTAETLSKLASKHIREVGEKVNAAKHAIKNPDAAKKLGVKVKKDARKLLDNALKEQQKWESWYTDSELYGQLMREAGISKMETTTPDADSVRRGADEDIPDNNAGGRSTVSGPEKVELASAETRQDAASPTAADSGRFNQESDAPLLSAEEDANDFQLSGEVIEETEERKIADRKKADAEKQAEKEIPDLPVAGAENAQTTVSPNGTEIIKLDSAAQITDEDFTAPYRSVELPPIPERTLKKIGKDSKPVLLKKNIFEKNMNHHPELNAEDGRKILDSALYNNDLIGQTQPGKRPNYFVAVKLKSGKNAVAVLDMEETKEHHEIVGWRIINDKGLENLQNQAVREGGQVLSSQSDNSRNPSDHIGTNSSVNTVPSDSGKVKGKIEDFGEKIAGAHGHPDNASTQAAQRSMAKREAYERGEWIDWKEPSYPEDPTSELDSLNATDKRNEYRLTNGRIERRKRQGKADTGNGRQYHIKRNAEIEKMSSDELSEQQKTEIRSAYDYAMNGEPVSRLSGQEFQKDDIPLTDKVTRYYSDLYNGVAVHPELGEVKLDLEGVKDSLGHGIGSKKAAAYAAVPQMIAKGKIFDRQKNWKNRGYDTVVMVAPLEIGGVPYVGEVVVEQRANRQGFYLHEVEIKEKLENAFKTPTKGSASPASRLIISQFIDKIKTESEENQKNSGNNPPNFIVTMDGKEVSGERDSVFYWLGKSGDFSYVEELLKKRIANGVNPEEAQGKLDFLQQNRDRIQISFNPERYFKATNADFNVIDSGLAEKLYSAAMEKQISAGEKIEVGGVEYTLDYVSIKSADSISIYYRSGNSVIRISDHWSETPALSDNKFNVGPVRSSYWTLNNADRDHVFSNGYNSLIGGIADFDSFTDNRPPKYRYSIKNLWTGSAADYDKPSIHYIGTGEGAQAYGWGLYAADQRGIGEWYAHNDVLRKTPELYYNTTAVFRDGKHIDYSEEHTRTDEAIYSAYVRNDGIPKQAEQWLKDELKEPTAGYTEDELKSALAEFSHYTYKQRDKSRHLYKQTFWADKEENLLEWDGTVTEEQKAQILDELSASESDSAVVSFVNRERDDWQIDDETGELEAEPEYYPQDVLRGYLDDYLDFYEATGEYVYKQLTNVLGSPQAASEFLYSAGIDGIRYENGEGTGYNYVAFSDEDIRVDEHIRYSLKRDNTVSIGEYPPDMPSAENPKELRDWLKAFYKEKDKPVNRDTGWSISVPATGLKETLSHIYRNRKGYPADLHYRTLPFIDTMLQKAKFDHPEEVQNGKKGDSVSIFNVPVDFGNGEVYNARMVIKHFGNDKNYYDHKLTEFEALPIQKLRSEELGSQGNASQEALPDSRLLPEDTGRRSNTSVDTIPQSDEMSSGDGKNFSLKRKRTQVNPVMEDGQIRQEYQDLLDSKEYTPETIPQWDEKAIEWIERQGGIQQSAEQIVNDTEHSDRHVAQLVRSHIINSDIFPQLPEKLREEVEFRNLSAGTNWGKEGAARRLASLTLDSVERVRALFRKLHENMPDKKLTELRFFVMRKTSGHIYHLFEKSWEICVFFTGNIGLTG